ncbi:MAG: elongation factor G [Candidatus Moeniiplasma glomeromycotorum]|nr:elongation factor G [Candidatus Moeniiplasma glomeromycotorum]MCE8168303.1 elongation factor G [Candidatus Moeniiplasma glomeromycotorum]MCE8169482.1 elongation factor G [Candidatus Moeniiplasma glomeromycotorum]
MPEKEKLARLRNIGIIAHIDAGKTTTTEGILYLTGKKHKVGKVHEGTATTDYDKQEQERGITIQSAAVTVYWKEHQINIIDTPGHLDFTGEVERSLRVLDGGIVILDGKEGVEAQTETVWQQANKYGIPRIIFINKMDGVDRLEKFTEALEAIQKRLNASPLVIQLPIGVGKNLKGVVDIVEQKAYYFQMGEKNENYEVKEIPTELVPQAKEAFQKLVEEVVEYDEKLFFKYSEGQVLTTDEIKHLVRQATLSGERFPVLCGSAYKHVGVKLVLEAVINYLPSPLDVGEVPVFSLQDQSKSGMVNWNSSLYCLALAFKIMFNERDERLTFFRVYAGKISPKSSLYNVNRGIVEKIGGGDLVRMHAEKEEEIKEIEAGDIAVVKGLKHTVTGDTLGDEKKPLLLETIGFAKAFFTQAIEPAKESDQSKLQEALKKLKIQDPTFDYHIEQRTGQMLIEGMGKLHLEISIEKLRGKEPKRLEIFSKQPKIIYQETITKKQPKVEAWYKKKTGGKGHDARIWITFEPNERGRGFEFIDKKKGDAMSNKDAIEVKKGLEEALSSGLLLNYPMVDVKATLHGGTRHEVDTQEGDFKRAAILAFRGDGTEERKKKARDLGVVLLEPIMQVELVFPFEYKNEVEGNLRSLACEVKDSEKKGNLVYVRGEAPLRTMFNYSETLLKITRGRGSCSMSFLKYEEVAPYVLQSILEEEKLSY